MPTLVAVSGLGDFVAGAVIGVLVGLLLARAFWSWLAWREWRDASTEADRRESRISDQILERMEQDLARGSTPAEPPRNDPWPRPRPY